MGVALLHHDHDASLSAELERGTARLQSAERRHGGLFLYVPECCERAGRGRGRRLDATRVCFGADDYKMIMSERAAGPGQRVTMGR